jgi:hypothetical protein
MMCEKYFNENNGLNGLSVPGGLASSHVWLNRGLIILWSLVQVQHGLPKIPCGC